MSKSAPVRMIHKKTKIETKKCFYLLIEHKTRLNKMFNMKLGETATTNKLLLIIIIPLLFYLLKVFDFIFAPLMLAFFITLLFMPMIRWLSRKGMHRIPAISLIMGIVVAGIGGLVFLIKLSGREIIEGKEKLYQLLDEKVGQQLIPIAKQMGLESNTSESPIQSVLFSDEVRSLLLGSFGETLVLVQHTASLVLMTLFFLVLLLAGSLNMETILGQTLFNNKIRSVRTYMVIEKSIARFLIVKFVVSFLTGLGFSIVAWVSGLSFPVFWGLLAFVLNFVQMIGSIVSTVLAVLFAYIEVDQTETVLMLAVAFTFVQVIFGSVIEPVFMGKSFRINIIAILIMLMFWGYLWGIPGMIVSIPMTVLIKTLLEQFEGTQKIAKLMA